MKNNTGLPKILGALVSSTLLALTVGFSAILPADARPAKKVDSLYVSDQNPNDNGPSPSKIRRFKANTGDDQGNFIVPDSGGLAGPRGLIFPNPGKLYVVNQNQDQEPLSGAILQYNGQTGKFLKAIVPATDTSSPNANPNAPYAPVSGMVLWQQTLFVTEFLSGDVIVPENGPPIFPLGRLLVYTKNGKFLKALQPDLSILPPGAEFHPRGIVVGPDGFIYISNYPNLLTGVGGQILRVNPKTGKFSLVISDDGGVGQLNRPDGLVFGPDGHLYITSFQANSSDTDSIRVYDISSGACKTKIDLDAAGQPGKARAFAQSAIFGPGGDLFVPISAINPRGGDIDLLYPDRGAVRRYDVTPLPNRRCTDVSQDPSENFTYFVKSNRDGGPMEAPQFLTFGKTNPGTLAYED